MVTIVVLGAGSAFELYAPSLQRLAHPVMVLDTDEGRADAAARQFGFTKMPLDYSRLPAKSCILNLTPPSVHGASSIELLHRGHAVYSEKPSSHEVRLLRQIARMMLRGARFAVAPDTHLCPAAQFAAEIIARERFGKVLRVRGVYGTPGHERWHPRPFSFYDAGGGVCLDIAPYFLRTVQALLGPLGLISVKNDMGARPDLAAPGVVARPVPLRSRIALATLLGVPVNFELAFGTRQARSSLTIRFAQHELTWDPVDAGSQLVLTHADARREVLVVPSSDGRGAGLASFVQNCPTDPYFGAGNAQLLLVEQEMLLQFHNQGNQK